MSSAHVDLSSAASAAEARTKKKDEAQNADEQFAMERDKRQAFRRLVDPGIMRPNSLEHALESIKILSTLAENLLRDPENPKFQQFKPTNDTIKRKIVERAGVLEFAIALGFRAEVKDFQPYYVFQPRYASDLRIGAAILQEALDLHGDKKARADKAKKEEKAVADAAVRNVHLAYLDDRKTKLQRDERDKQVRDAKAAKAAAAAARAAAGAGSMSPPSSPSSPTMPGAASRMPGTGHRLTGDADVDDMNADPPAYTDSHSVDNADDE